MGRRVTTTPNAPNAELRLGRYVLVIDDDALMPKVVEAALGMPVVSLTTLKDLDARTRALSPTAVFVDVHLADGETGIDALPALRARFPRLPILVMTSDGEPARVAEALAAGADDFLLKPIRPTELLARLQARLADHSKADAATVRRSGDVRLDSAHKELSGPGAKVALSSIEVTLLGALLDAKGTVVSRKQIRRVGWGKTHVSENAIDRRIHELRQRLTEVGSHYEIQTARGRGFALVARAERKAS